MGLVDKLNRLVANCKFSVSITVNGHRDVEQTIDEFIGCEDTTRCMDILVYNEMVKTNTSIEIQCYNETPSGCYVFYHYDLEMAIDNALNELEK